MKFLVESGGTGTDTFQTCHAFGTLFDNELLHNKEIPFSFIFCLLYKILLKIAMGIFANFHIFIAESSKCAKNSLDYFLFPCRYYRRINH